MELQRLRFFLMNQPFSNTINRLEDELGIRLLTCVEIGEANNLGLLRGNKSNRSVVIPAKPFRACTARPCFNLGW